MKSYIKQSGAITIAAVALLGVVVTFGLASMDVVHLIDQKQRLDQASESVAIDLAIQQACDPVKSASLKPEQMIRGFLQAYGVENSQAAAISFKCNVNNNPQIKIDLQLGGLFNYTAHSTNTFNTDSQPLGAPFEIAMVLDISSSMIDSPFGETPNAPIAQLRNSVVDFIDLLPRTSSGLLDRVRVSHVPFSDYIFVGNTCYSGYLRQDLSATELAKIVSKPGWPDESRNSCPAQKRMRFLTSDPDQIKADIRDLKAQGGTNLTGGLAWGWRTLSQTWTKHRPAGSEAALAGDSEKILLLVTDAQIGFDKTRLIDRGSDSFCDVIKNSGVTIYTLGIGVDADGKDTLSQCASSPDNFYDVTDAADLHLAFEALFESLRRKIVLSFGV